MSTSLYMGGTANFEFVEPAQGYLVAMTGGFAGAAFARVIGDPIDIGNGRLELNMEHQFIHQDGSLIFTKDKGLLILVNDDPRVLASTIYKVQKTTGRFAGLTGEFRSWGSINNETQQGVLRFSGELK